MNAALRHQIRQAIDQQARARINTAHHHVCTGCGGELHGTTRGCKRCYDRKRRRERRQDPAFNEAENARQRAHRAKRACLR